MSLSLLHGASTAKLYAISLKTTKTRTQPATTGLKHRSDPMSKNKPKATYEVVIRMQDKERQLLDSLTTAYMLGNTGKFLGPIVAGLSDVTFVVTMVILYEYFSGKDTGIINGSIETIGDLKNAWLAYRASPAYQEEYAARATSATGGLRNIFDQIIFSLTGAGLPMD